MANEKVFKLALEIQQLLESVDQRCAAAYGPVTPTNEEITAKELRRIYVTALKIKAEC
jgi:hypothetical protein